MLTTSPSNSPQEASTDSRDNQKDSAVNDVANPVLLNQDNGSAFAYPLPPPPAEIDIVTIDGDGASGVVIVSSDFRGTGENATLEGARAANVVRENGGSLEQAARASDHAKNYVVETGGSSKAEILAEAARKQAEATQQEIAEEIVAEQEQEQEEPQAQPIEDEEQQEIDQANELAEPTALDELIAEAEIAANELTTAEEDLPFEELAFTGTDFASREELLQTIGAADAPLLDLAFEEL